MLAKCGFSYHAARVRTCQSAFAKQHPEIARSATSRTPLMRAPRGHCINPATITLFYFRSPQPMVTVNATGKLLVRVFARARNTRTRLQKLLHSERRARFLSRRSRDERPTNAAIYTGVIYRLPE